MRKLWKGNRSYFPSIVAIVVAIVILSGCSGKDDKIAETLSATQVGNRIVQSMNLQDMKEGDQNKLQKWYKIDADSVDDFILYTTTSNVRADELAVIKVKDQSQAASVKEKIEQRIEAQKIKFKDYRPNEYFLVENHVLKTNGPFVFFAVSKEVAQMEEAFDDACKQIQ